MLTFAVSSNSWRAHTIVCRSYKPDDYECVAISEKIIEHARKHDEFCALADRKSRRCPRSDAGHNAEGIGQ